MVQWARPHSIWVASLIADPGVLSLIPAQSHTLAEIDQEIFSTVILLFLLIQDGLFKLHMQKYVHSVLVNR